MKNTSIRFGYKNFWLTSSDRHPYFRVPYTGAKGIAGTPGQLHLYNWFFSYELISLLSATATIQKDRNNNCPIISDAHLKKEERGTSKEVE